MLDTLTVLGHVMSMDLLKTIRKEFKTCGESRYKIAQNTGIEQAVLCRIAKGGSCKTQTTETLLQYFGYKLVKAKRGGN
jgi:hypothetical protein